MASPNDKFRSPTSGTRPETAYLTATKAVGASTAAVNTTSGWNTDTGIDFVLFIKDTSSSVLRPLAGTLTTWSATVSGTTLNNLTLRAGTEPVGGYPSGENSVVIATPTASWADYLIDGILTEHNKDGTHGSITTTGYSQASGSFSVPNNSIDANELSTSAITLGYAQITSNFTTTSSTAVQVTGLSTTVTIPAGGRRVKITVYAYATDSSVSGSSTFLGIWDGTVGSGTFLHHSTQRQNAVSNGSFHIAMAVVTPSAGSKTYNAGFSVVGGGTANLVAAASTPAFILVEAI